MFNVFLTIKLFCTSSLAFLYFIKGQFFSSSKPQFLDSISIQVFVMSGFTHSYMYLICAAQWYNRKQGTPSPPCSLLLCSLPIFTLTYFPCQINWVKMPSKSAKKLLGIEFGNICKGYKTLGNIFILRTLILPSQDTGRVPHLCRSSLICVMIGLILSLTSFFRDGQTLIPRYVISLWDH